MERVTGIGGVFFRAREPELLRQWYAEHLGISPAPGTYEDDAWSQEAGPTVWAPFPLLTDYFGRPDQTWMVNFRVRDLDAMVAQLRGAGLDVEMDTEQYPNGRFARLVDLEGNPIELWEPSIEPPQLETLPQLTDVVHRLLGQPDILQTIDRLKKEVRVCEGPFVWSVIDTSGQISRELPAHIKSAWIFVLKKDTRSICHFHPNSIQHMALVEGRGSSEIGGIRRAMRRYDSSTVVDDVWTVIDKNVPHEFFPERTDMVVLSFHTCAAEDLIEIECGTGRQRRYEVKGEDLSTDPRSSRA